MDEHDWRAYPHFAPPEQFAAFQLAKGIFYNNAWENAASAMVRCSYGMSERCSGMSTLPAAADCRLVATHRVIFDHKSKLQRIPGRLSYYRALSITGTDGNLSCTSLQEMSAIAAKNSALLLHQHLTTDFGLVQQNHSSKAAENTRSVADA